jgi:hypothetical protein
LEGKTAGTQFGQLNVTGAATLNGTLDVTLAAGYSVPNYPLIGEDRPHPKP